MQILVQKPTATPTELLELQEFVQKLISDEEDSTLSVLWRSLPKIFDELTRLVATLPSDTVSILLNSLDRVRLLVSLDNV